jgi:GMP synthase-like glutamine amidotransferase
MFLRLFTREAPELDLVRIDAVAGAPLPDLDAVDAVDAVIVSGSRHDAVADTPWIGQLAAFLRRAYARDLPTVGICFGHQLIAHALGGRVERATRGWGVGVHDAELTEAGAATLGAPARFSLLHSHQDQVVELPPGGQVVASTPHAPIAALRVGSLLGFQGHPEFRQAYAAALMESRTDRIPAEVRERARDSLVRPTQHAEVARWIAAHLTGTHR